MRATAIDGARPGLLSISRTQWDHKPPSPGVIRFMEMIDGMFHFQFMAGLS
jgi:hypothetical protein